MNLELQTRAVEYTSLFTKHNSIRASIVERMPILVTNQTINSNLIEEETPQNIGNSTETEPVVNYFRLLLFNRINIFRYKVNLLEMLDSNPPTTTNGNSLEQILFFDDNLSNIQPTTTTTTTTSSSIPSMNVFNKNGLKIDFNFEKQNDLLLISLQAINSTLKPIENFLFKAAVPKVNPYQSYVL